MVWRRDPRRQTEGYYVYIPKIQVYCAIHYIKEDHLWLYIVVDKGNKWYTIKPVPLKLGLGPTLQPTAAINIDEEEDPSEETQNTGTTSLMITPAAIPTSQPPTSQGLPTTMSTATTTITQPSGSGTLPPAIPPSGGGGGGGGGSGGRGLPAGVPPAGRAPPLNGKLGGNPPAKFDGNYEKS